MAFYSAATNLVSGDTNGVLDIFVYDRQSDSIERVSVGGSGTQEDDNSYTPSLSADGLYVAFASLATNLVAEDSNGVRDIFMCSRQSGSIERVSVDAGGTQGNGASYTPLISADGRYVAFASEASNLVVGDTNGCLDIFAAPVP